MVMDALRGYVQLANGLTEVTRQRAQQAAKALVQQTGAETLTTGLTTRVSDLADEIVATSKSNRQLLQAIVANEVEGAVARLGFVRVEEVDALSRRVQVLERELADAAAEAAAEAAASAVAATAPPATPTRPARKAAKRPGAKKTAAVQAPAVGTVDASAHTDPSDTAGATGALPVKAPSKAAVKAPAKTAVKAPAKKAAVKATADAPVKTPAKKVAAKKSAGKKSAGKKSAAQKSVAKKA